jgi:hypothetical protein
VDDGKCTQLIEQIGVADGVEVTERRLTQPPVDRQLEMLDAHPGDFAGRVWKPLKMLELHFSGQQESL